MNRTRLLVCLLAAMGFLAIGERAANAQTTFQNFNTRRNAATATRDYLYNRPTVSPYLNLTSRDASIGMPNYFTMVRPQVEQRQENLMQQRQTANMQAQINQVQTEVRQSQQNAANMMITGRIGWSARGYPRFGTYMSYYPGFQRIAR